MATIGLTTREARADDMAALKACLAAAESAQDLRDAGKLAEARKQLNVCTREGCPSLVRQDCIRWTDEVLATMPTIVPGARDPSGRDLVHVKLAIDGQLAGDTLVGNPIALDPGVHTLTFELVGAQPVEYQIVLRQGEKNRVVVVTLRPATRGEDTTVQRAETGQGDYWTTRRIAGAAATGGGVIAMVAGGAWALLARAQYDRATGETGLSRHDDSVSAIGKADAASVVLGVGSLLVAAGLVVWLTAPSSKPPASSGRERILSGTRF
jgi:hypothetical protein